MAVKEKKKKVKNKPTKFVVKEGKAEVRGKVYHAMRGMESVVDSEVDLVELFPNKFDYYNPLVPPPVSEVAASESSDDDSSDDEELDSKGRDVTSEYESAKEQGLEVFQRDDDSFDVYKDEERQNEKPLSTKKLKRFLENY